MTNDQIVCTDECYFRNTFQFLNQSMNRLSSPHRGLSNGLGKSFVQALFNDIVRNMGIPIGHILSTTTSTVYDLCGMPAEPEPANAEEALRGKQLSLIRIYSYCRCSNGTIS